MPPVEGLSLLPIDSSGVYYLDTNIVFALHQQGQSSQNPDIPLVISILGSTERISKA